MNRKTYQARARYTGGIRVKRYPSFIVRIMDGLNPQPSTQAIVQQLQEAVAAKAIS